MPRNPTTGEFVRVDNSFSDPVTNTVISPSDANDLFDDYDSGLTESLAWYQPPRIVTASGDVTVTDSEAGVMINKTVGAATSVILPSASARTAGLPVLVKDLKGDAGTNNITVSVSGGQLIDGNATYPIISDYGWTRFYPLVDGSGYWVGP